MSHHNDHTLLIIILFVLFPGAFVALGFGYILFYLLIGIIYVIYTYFVPIFIVGIIVFVLYALSRKQDTKKISSTSSEAITKQASPAVSEDKSFKTEYEDTSYQDFEGRGDDDQDEETRRLMEEHDLDQDDAEKVQEITEEWGIDEDEAVELLDDL